MALLDDHPRTATVIAKSGVVVDVISRADFAVLLDLHPEISEKLHAAKTRHRRRMKPVESESATIPDPCSALAR